jgi:hypothetical protein
MIACSIAASFDMDVTSVPGSFEYDDRTTIGTP